MDVFPAFFPLAGRKVVIAGAGEAAEAKARLFEGSPALVVRVDGPAAFLPGSYSGACLAFVAGDDDLFLQAASGAARAARVLVNVVDRPLMSDFQTPAVIDRGQVVAAVGTGGASPLLAAMLRSDIEARVPEGAGRVAALLRRHQEAVREALPDLVARRAFLREALSGPVADAAMKGETEQASVLLLEALKGAGQPQGRVLFVAGRGPADLLTLRAARALAQADVLAADAETDPAVLAMARRDAQRLAPEEATPEHLAALALTGKQVVRIIAAPVDPAELRPLAEAGVNVDVLLAAPGT